MNKKLFLKLGLLLLSLSLVACGQKDNSSEAANSSKQNANQIVDSTESSVTESEKTKDSLVENVVENKKDNEDAKQNNKPSTKQNAKQVAKQNTKPSTKQNAKQVAKQNTKPSTKQDTKKGTKNDTKQKLTEKEYYNLIKEAWQKQKNYIDSINDHKVKQSVQTTQSAATSKSNELLMKHPEDSKAINASLKKVLAGE